jgi:hypothetical protein
MPAVVTYPRVLRAGVRKPLRKEPARAGRTACRLWRFDGAAAWVGDAPGGVAADRRSQWRRCRRGVSRWGDFGLIDGVDRVLDPWRELIAFARSTSAAKVQFDLIESALGRKL